MDALASATGITAADVQSLTDRYRGARHWWRVFDAVALMDGKAQSPRESMVRLALLDAGFPKPRTQFTVTDGDSTATLAMGYEAPMVTVQFTSTTPEFIERIGWRTISAADSRNPLVVAGLVRFAVIERGYPLWKLRRLNFAAAT